MKIRRRFSFLKLYIYVCIVFFIVLIIYNEIFSYHINTTKWQVLQCENRNKCTKILLVADPQIIGNTKEILHFLTPISIFDSDRYLSKTYTQAYNFVQPDVVIFLGDLMDEAHIANTEEFYQYVRRIFDIFLDDRFQQNKAKHIWLPGDNDIGGEDSMISADKLERFQHAFFQPDVITINNITFFKINRLTMDVPVFKTKREFYDNSNIFIGLSHIPLMFKPALFVDKVIYKMLPHVLFTAHEHKSMVISTDALLRREFHIIPVTPDNNQIFDYEMGVTDMYEIIIPTCSYRMGTDKIGYGYALIENTDLRFTVLWSPSRFLQLRIYFVVFCMFSVCGLLLTGYKKCTYFRTKYYKYELKDSI